MKDEKFAKVLGRREVISLSLGAIIGWGWVVLSGGIILDAGSLGGILAFLVAGVIFTTIGLVYAELAAAMPLAGGEHVYSYKALGKNASFLCTWSLVLTYVSVVALQAAALPVAFEYFFPNMKYGYLWTFAGYEVYFSYVVFGVMVAIGITILNIRGIKLSSTFQNIATLFIILIGFVFAFGAFFLGGSMDNIQPLFANAENPISGIAKALVVIPFLLVGFDVIPQAAEEINMSPRNVSKVMLSTIFFAILWYAMVVFGLAMALPKDQIVRAGFSVADGAVAVFGASFFGKLMIACGIAGILTSWNAFMIGGSRAIYAMAESNMVPQSLANIHPKYKSPYNALILITVIAIASALLGRKAMIFFVNAGSFSLLIAYALVAVSFVVLRKTHPQMERPYFVKNGRWIGIGAVVFSLGLAVLFLPTMPAALVSVEWLIVVFWYVLGVVFFRLAQKKRSL
jgi:basic amino acid/polyamine antiporter, APA family